MTVSASINSIPTNIGNINMSLDESYLYDKPVTNINENNFPFYGSNPNIFEDNSGFSSYVSNWVFKDNNTVYAQIQHDARVLPFNELFRDLISEYFSTLFYKNLFNIYKNAPTYFNTLFPVNNGNIMTSSNTHTRYQKFFYLLCMIDYVNDTDNADHLASIPDTIRELIIDWCKTRKDESIPYTLEGPVTNSSIDLKTHERYDVIISPTTQTQSNTIEHLTYSKLENIQNETIHFHDDMVNRNNSYDKLKNEARQYVINLDTFNLVQKYTEDDILYFDLGSCQYGDTSEQNTFARLDQIDQVKVYNVTTSKINVMKLQTIFNNYSLLNVQKFVVNKFSYITDLSVLKQVYIVFKGIECSLRTVNANIPSSDLTIGGSFSTNENGDYVFTPDNEFVSYRTTRTFIKNALMYITTSPNDPELNLIIPNVVNTVINNIDVFNFPIQLLSIENNELTYISYWQQVSGTTEFTGITMIYDGSSGTGQIYTNTRFDLEVDLVAAIKTSVGTISTETMVFKSMEVIQLDNYIPYMTNNPGGSLYDGYNVELKHYIENDAYTINYNILGIANIDQSTVSSSAEIGFLTSSNNGSLYINSIEITYPFTDYKLTCAIDGYTSDIDSIVYILTRYSARGKYSFSVKYFINGDGNTMVTVYNDIDVQDDFTDTFEIQVSVVPKSTDTNGNTLYMYAMSTTVDSNYSSTYALSVNSAKTLIGYSGSSDNQILISATSSGYNVLDSSGFDGFAKYTSYGSINYINPFVLENMLLYNLTENEINTMFATINMNNTFSIPYTIKIGESVVSSLTGSSVTSAAKYGQCILEIDNTRTIVPYLNIIVYNKYVLYNTIENPDYTSVINWTNIPSKELNVYTAPDFYTESIQTLLTLLDTTTSGLSTSIPYLSSEYINTYFEANMIYFQYRETTNQDDASTVVPAKVVQLEMSPFIYDGTDITLKYNNDKNLFYIEYIDSSGDADETYIILNEYIYISGLDIYIKIDNARVNLYSTQLTSLLDSTFAVENNITSLYADLPINVSIYVPGLSRHYELVDLEAGSTMALNAYNIITPVVSNNIDDSMFYIYDNMSLLDMKLSTSNTTITGKIPYYFRNLETSSSLNSIIVNTPITLSHADYVKIFGSQYINAEAYAVGVNQNLYHMLEYVQDKLYGITNIYPGLKPSLSYINVMNLYIYLYKSDLQMSLKWL